MTGLHNYTGFIVTVVIFQAVPGAGTIAIPDAATRNGVIDGMKAVLGTLAGNTAARRLSRWRVTRVQASRPAGVALVGFAVKLRFDGN